MDVKLKMIELMTRCAETLREDKELNPAQACGVLAMVLTEELAQEALAITGGSLLPYFMAILHIHIIRVLNLRYEDYYEAGEIPDSLSVLEIKDDLEAASSILSKCWGLTHSYKDDEGAEMLCCMMKNRERVMAFVESVKKARSDFNDISFELWSVL